MILYSANHFQRIMQVRVFLIATLNDSRSMALMIKAASTSETSVNFYRTTQRNDSEDSNLHTRRSENLKSHYCSYILKCVAISRKTNNYFSIIKHFNEARASMIFHGLLWGHICLIFLFISIV
jgi:hypothetical protein